MNKRTMHCVFAGMLAAVMMWAPLAFAESSANAQTQITVQGSGSVSAEPDMVSVTVNASALADTPLGAQTQVSRTIEELIAALLELGVSGEDIVTSGYSCSPRYSYEEAEPRLTGYYANHMLEITCRDIALLDSVITAATDSGAAEISGVSYGLSDRSGLYEQALELAVRAAREKAEAMAAAGGKALVNLASLTENQSYDSRYAMVSTAKAEDVVNTGIRSGSVSVSASVTAVYDAQ